MTIRLAHGGHSNADGPGRVADSGYEVVEVRDAPDLERVAARPSEDGWAEASLWVWSDQDDGVMRGDGGDAT